MRNETEAQKLVRELQAEAAAIDRAEKRARHLATVEKFKQIEGWEQKVCDAVWTLSKQFVTCPNCLIAMAREERIDAALERCTPSADAKGDS